MREIRILVVDDEVKLRGVIRSYLERDGYAVGEAADGEEALAEFAAGSWDLVILDLMMPKVDGWEVLRGMRRTTQVPVILLTARSDELDRVLGLELGADDYVVKPFSPRELVARVKAVLRRTRPDEVRSPENGGNVLERSGLVIDPDGREVRIEGHMVTLSPKEFDLLYQLARYPGRAWRRDELLDRVWGFDFFGDTRTVDTNVNRLREKLAVHTAKRFIRTVWGYGYKFEVYEDENHA